MVLIIRYYLFNVGKSYVLYPFYVLKWILSAYLGVVTAKRKFTMLRHIFSNTDVLKQFLNISGSEVIRKKNSHKTVVFIFDEL